MCDDDQEEVVEASSNDIDDNALEKAVQKLIGNRDLRAKMYKLAESANVSGNAERLKLAIDLRDDIGQNELKLSEALYCAGWAALAVEDIKAQVVPPDKELEDALLLAKLKRAIVYVASPEDGNGPIRIQGG